MLTRRLFTQCTACVAAGMLSHPVIAKAKPIVFCASAVDPADATFYEIDEIDWQYFYLNDVPGLFSKCCSAIGISQTVRFSDELPIQASWNSLDPSDPQNPKMYIGVGNLEAYPFSALIAVFMHELGHIFCYRSDVYPKILSNSVKRQRELLADMVAGGAYAKMEYAGLTTKELVRGQCSLIIIPENNTWLSGEQESSNDNSDEIVKDNKAKLNSRRLLTSRASQAEFKVLRADGSINRLENYSMIGGTPDEDPDATRCFTVHDRTVDFVAMVAAVSSWRTFGDLPDEGESHGSPAERYQAFAFGYNICRGNRKSLDECLTAGVAQLGIHI